MQNDENDKMLQLGRAVLENESAAISALLPRINSGFALACRLILDCKGRTVVTGMGKSGHIANKIAATFASTGTPAFFMHPGEAGHGDLGMITPADLVIALSNSGETDEVIALLPVIKRLDIPLISLTGNPSSSLARNASVNIDVSVAKEACPLGLAPTSSTTAALAMGDALAVALLESRGFSKNDFARSHPGGMLGRRLLLRVFDIMHTGEEIPRVGPRTALRDVLIIMSEKGLGTAVVTDDEGKVTGIFSDGDIRRTLATGTDINTVTIDNFMSPGCKTITANALTAEALKMMEEFSINALPVVDDNGSLEGIINMHDLLRARVV